MEAKPSLKGVQEKYLMLVDVWTGIMWELYIYVNAGKVTLSPYGNSRLWLLELSRDWIKEVARPISLLWTC
jgi:hypothetical protein